MTEAANTSNSTPVRDRVLPNPPKVAVINETKLDMSPEEFTARLAATQVSHKQFFQLTDITRPRLKRVCDGEKKSLVERKPGVFVVPRLFVVVLLAIESGLLVVGEESC